MCCQEFRGSIGLRINCRLNAKLLAVAFWGSGATTALGLDVAEPHERRISIICNLAMGGTNPHEIEKLRKLSGVEVRQCDTLHAKIYKFSDAAMVGSSNVSANGLSFEGPLVKSWHEANLVTTDEKTLVGITNWIDALPTQEIDDGDLELAKVAGACAKKIGLQDQ